MAGERFKIDAICHLIWAVDFGDQGQAMALTPDSTFLIAGAFINGNITLGFLNSTDGSVLASYRTTSSGNYNYITTRDS